MKLVIFGLSISSSWGNGHATIWRGLCRALGDAGHCVAFFERDVPYYAQHRDFTPIAGVELFLYSEWSEVFRRARRELREAEVGVVTSYCPDGIQATELVLDSSPGLRVFYDLDTPVTLERWNQGQPLTYVGENGLGGFDLVLSYTGGRAITELRERLGALRVAPLYGSFDPRVHAPVPSSDLYRADLSYLGTYSADRQQALERLFLEPARRLPERLFIQGGPLFPAAIEWPRNVRRLSHVPPSEHPAFYCSSPLTLNVTRGAMAEMGYCPSGRLFEAAGCAVPVVSDDWEGLDLFFEPEKEILLAESALAVEEALALPAEALARVGRAARRRALDEHTCERRAGEMLEWFDLARAPAGVELESRSWGHSSGG